MGLIRKIRHPELFQGSLRRRGYFEGWYFKLISKDRTAATAVIPGLALGSVRGSSNSHAFVQFINQMQTEYFTYPLSAFKADDSVFHVAIGDNSFSRDGISLNLGGGKITGELQFSDVLPFPATLFYPGIMGPYSYIPGLECYHGIVSIRHRINGSLNIGGKAVCFDDGSGYVEKDWGRAFPNAWIWVQANHFKEDAAFLFSVADIPWLRGSFRGFFAFLYFDGMLHRFATYTGARIVRLFEYSSVTEAVIKNHSHTLEIAACPGAAGMLRAPKNGLMDRLIEESISSTVAVRLTDKDGIILFDSASTCAGLERYDAHKIMDVNSAQ